MTKKERLTNLAKNLKKERKKLDLSQQKLAEKANLSMTTVTQIEQCRLQNPTLDTIEALGRVFKMPNPFDLFKK